ncbi:MAG: DnaB-like helicase N-terminal domain-containing protein, partial [Candidatus Eremiobacterota bacterium]
MTGKTITCRNCGGNMELTEGVNKIFCLYCGTQNLLTDVPEILEVELTCNRSPITDHRPPMRISGMGGEFLNKIPPRSLEAEQATLGSMIIEPDCISAATEILRSEDFYFEGHKIIFKAITSLYEKGEPVDIITLNSELKKLGKIEEVGGIAYLTALVNTVPTAANIEYYAKIVAEKGILREIIKTGTKITGLGYREDGIAEQLVDSAESMIFQLGKRQKMQDFIPMGSVMKESFRKVEHLYHNKAHVTGVTSGY